MNDEPKDIASNIVEEFTSSQRSKRDAEILGKMSEIIDEVKRVKVTYRENENNSELMDFFLDGRYIESCKIQPKIFLEFRASKYEEGFRSGVTYSLNKILQFIQDKQ